MGAPSRASVPGIAEPGVARFEWPVVRRPARVLRLASEVPIFQLPAVELQLERVRRTAIAWRREELSGRRAMRLRCSSRRLRKPWRWDDAYRRGPPGGEAWTNPGFAPDIGAKFGFVLGAARGPRPNRGSPPISGRSSVSSWARSAGLDETEVRPLICAGCRCQAAVWVGRGAGWRVRIGCARAPSLISVCDPGWLRIGDMMVDGVVPLGDAVRPLGLWGPSTRAWRQGAVGSRPRCIGVREGCARGPVVRPVAGRPGRARAGCGGCA
jgi:hypothetical protein